MNKQLINTWRQGSFIDDRRYDSWSDAAKQNADQREKHLVRPGPLDNAICCCQNPDDAKFIAEQLNYAARMRKAEGQTT